MGVLGLDSERKRPRAIHHYVFSRGGPVMRVIRAAKWPFAIIISLIACSPMTLPPGGPGDPCEIACSRRKSLGCLESALALNCIPVCKHAVDAGIFDSECVVQASTVEEMRACNVRCQ